MEIDITDFVLTAETHNFSASIAEMGPDAGKITWANAVRDAEATQVHQRRDPRRLRGLGQRVRRVDARRDRDVVARRVQRAADPVHQRRPERAGVPVLV